MSTLRCAAEDGRQILHLLRCSEHTCQLTKSRKAGHLTGYLVVLIVMIVLNIVAAFFSSNAWNFKYERRRVEAAKQAHVHRAALDKMIEEQDYIAMRTYYYNNRLSGVDAFREYEAVMKYAGNLGDVYMYLCFREYEAVMKYAGNLGDVYMYLCNTDRYGYWKSEKGLENTVTSMSSNIISLYENPLSSYYDEESVTEEKLAVIEDIRNQAEALLVTYGGFTSEEAQELKNMSKSRIEDTLREHLTAIRTEREAEESAAEAALDESFSLKEFYEEYFGGDDV